MNKQELIRKYEYMNRNLEMWVGTSNVLEDLKQLDEPQKVKIPKFVAECIEYAQASDWDLEDVFQSIANELDTSEISEWFYSKSENMDTLASAWLYGYEIKKEPRYTVKMKNKAGDEDYLVKTGVNGLRFYNNIYTERRKHTRKELEIAGFGWVFNCPGIEIEEVE